VVLIHRLVVLGVDLHCHKFSSPNSSYFSQNRRFSLPISAQIDEQLKQDFSKKSEPAKAGLPAADQFISPPRSLTRPARHHIDRLASPWLRSAPSLRSTPASRQRPRTHTCFRLPQLDRTLATAPAWPQRPPPTTAHACPSRPWPRLAPACRSPARPAFRSLALPQRLQLAHKPPPATSSPQLRLAPRAAPARLRLPTAPAPGSTPRRHIDRLKPAVTLAKAGIHRPTSLRPSLTLTFDIVLIPYYPI
jgi:hypothetical protein